MITISNSMFALVGLGMILFYIVMFAIGWQKGIFRAAIDLFGTLAAIWLAWLAAPALAEFLSIWPHDWTPLQATPAADIVYMFMNEVCLFFLVFLVLKVLIALFENICKSVKYVPGINLLASAAGGIFQLGVAVLWTLVLSAILSMPLFTNGRDLVNNTVIGRVCDLAEEVSAGYLEPFMQSEAFGEIVNGASDLQGASADAIRAWFAEHGQDLAGFEIYTGEAVG